uniref:Translation initiation factor IF-2, chloroplastic n=1 Tax=Herposiphonia versicolor TaxID=2007163 RepID=A0A1Z1MG94_9FLOR|nr:translation initiation factor 2 [Herposiphonia versicolor]ARW64774.1 translation initiation factor 2 [Herposiphonia versicolor]
MLNFFYKDEKFLRFQVFNFVNVFISSLYYNDSLILKFPKLINFFNKRFSSSLTTLSVNEIVNEDINSINTSSHKFDKKQRSNIYGQNFKKSKNKLSKHKIKNSVQIENVNLFDNTSDDLFTQDLLNRSSNKPRKVGHKNKKQYKDKIEILDNKNLSKNSNQYQEIISELKSDNLEKIISLTKNLTIQELSRKMNIPEAEIITYLFLNKGISATINELLDLSTIRNIAENYNYTIVEIASDDNLLKYQSKQLNNSSNNIIRSPIVTILGHVDHGKTTLLDAILKTNLVTKEQGGITQSISGYEVNWSNALHSHSLIFLDTPGHESFQKMRLRGAKVTDIILLVIAIDDGIKPQTIEVIDYIKQLSLSSIVVITKSDKLSNNLEKIKQDLASYDLLCEELGGNIPMIEVSAISGHNIDILLSKICLLADKKNFLADPSVLATGTILEAYLDKKQGPIANIVVQNGTLHIGDIVAAEYIYGRVKSITNNSGVKIKLAGPSSLVKVLAFNNVPEAGSTFSIYASEKDAKAYCVKYSGLNKVDNKLKSLDTRITLDQLSDSKQLKIILKTNSQGTLEAILNLLGNISQSKVQINIVFANCGDVSNNDIELAIATSAIIVAFDVNIPNQIKRLLKQHKIIFTIFNIIYDLLNYVETLMLDLIEPEYDEVLVGQAVVKTVFNMHKGYVAGCIVTDGKLNIKSYIHVYRNKLIVYQGFISSLKQMKSDVNEVSAPNECGLMADFDLWKNNDIIKAHDLISQEKTL